MFAEVTLNGQTGGKKEDVKQNRKTKLQWWNRERKDTTWTDIHSPQVYLKAQPCVCLCTHTHTCTDYRCSILLLLSKTLITLQSLISHKYSEGRAVIRVYIYPTWRGENPVQCCPQGWASPTQLCCHGWNQDNSGHTWAAFQLKGPDKKNNEWCIQVVKLKTCNQRVINRGKSGTSTGYIFSQTMNQFSLIWFWITVTCSSSSSISKRN